MRNDRQATVGARMILGLGTLSLLALLILRPLPKGDAAESAPSAPPSIRIDKGSQLWLEGDSTLHKYRLDAKGLDVRVGEAPSAGSGGLAAVAEQGAIKTLDVHVSVAKLTSGEGGPDDNMRKALSSEKYPEIRFQMDSYRATPGVMSANLALAIKGRLEIAGVEKPIELEAAATRVGSTLHVTGVKQLLITDYGVKPPKFMLGMMSVSDPVAIHFDLTLEPNP